MSEDIKKEEVVLEKEEQEVKDLQFAFGATLDEEDNKFEESIEKAKESIDKFGETVANKYEEIKNDPELKEKLDNAKEKTVKAFNDGKEKVKEVYESEKVQKAIKDVGEKADEVKDFVSDKINDFTSKPEVEEKIESGKKVVLTSFSKLLDKVKGLFKRDKQ